MSETKFYDPFPTFTVAQLRADNDALRAHVETLTQERDEAMDQLRIIVKELPAPPWMEQDGGSEWEPWCQWLSTQVADLAAALAREQALREALKKTRTEMVRLANLPLPYGKVEGDNGSYEHAHGYAMGMGQALLLLPLVALQPPDAPTEGQ